MPEIRIVKYTNVVQPSYLITFSVYNGETRSGTALDAVVHAADVEGKTDREIADVAWEQVRVKADAFMADSTSTSGLVNMEYTPTTPWP